MSIFLCVRQETAKLYISSINLRWTHQIQTENHHQCHFVPIFLKNRQKRTEEKNAILYETRMKEEENKRDERNYCADLTQRKRSGSKSSRRTKYLFGEDLNASKKCSDFCQISRRQNGLAWCLMPSTWTQKHFKSNFFKRKKILKLVF